MQPGGEGSVDDGAGPTTGPTTVLAGARLVTPDALVAPGWLSVAGGRIAGTGPGEPPGAAGATVIDLAGHTVLPGCIDLHVHGGGGGSFGGDGVDLARTAVEFHRAGGTTRTLASVVSGSEAVMARAAAELAELADDGALEGIHLEGPFLSALHCGAHDPAALADPDPALADRLLAAGRGRVRMVTLAPERPGALDLVRHLVAQGVVVALGHSAATYDEACRAIDAGARVVTHLYNAMAAPHHRRPGLVGAALDRTEVTAELIADGVHLHPATLRTAFAAARDRVALVTDALPAAGLGDGRFRFAGRELEVTGGVARLASGPVAGSTVTSGQAVRHAVVEAGLGLVEAARAAATRPAAVLGLDHRTGSLAVGRDADLMVLDADLRVAGVMVRGVWWGSRPGA